MKISNLEKVRTLASARADWAIRLKNVRSGLPLSFRVYAWDPNGGGRPVIPNWICNRRDEHPALRAYCEAMILDQLAAIDRQLDELGVEVGQ